MFGLSYSSFQGHRQQFLGFGSKLHGQFLKDFLGITVDDESYGLLNGDSPLIAVE